MEAGDVVRVSEDVVAREVGGELVLMHLDSGIYFGLNAVGTRVWELLTKGEHSIAEICAIMSGEFDADPAVIEADVLALAGELADHGLITASEGRSG